MFTLFDFLYVYSKDEQGKLQKIGSIDDVIECKEHLEINGLYSLEFTVPMDSEKLLYIKEEDVTKYLFGVDGRLYYPIEKIADTDNQIYRCICRSVITLLDKYIFINIYPIEVNKTCIEVLQKTLDIREENPELPDYEFKLFTPQELSERGLQWVSEPFDILNGFDYVTGYDMIGNCLNLAGRGELYFENFKFAIVERIGKDTNYVWDRSDNITSLTYTKNYDEMINVILVEGKDGMPLDLELYPESVIVDSESVAKYGVRRGRLYFSDITDKDELARRANWEIDALNPDRVSMPKETLNATAIDVSEKLNLGDGVKIRDMYDNIMETRRIVSIDINWANRGEDVYNLGEKALTELQLLAKLEATRQTVNNIITSNGDVDTSFINLIVSAIDGRNRCKNSKFSIFDRLGLPKYWLTQNAAVTELDSRFGTFSLKLVERGLAFTDYMDYNDWNDESTMTLIEIWYKKSFEVAIVAVDDDGELYDEPVIIPHQTKYDMQKVASSQFSCDYWSPTPAYLIVYNQDMPENGKFRVMIQGVHNEPVYIGGIFVGPGNLSQIKLYSDGPHSDRFDEEGADMISFTRQKNEEEIDIASETEEYISDIQLASSDATQLDMQICLIAETEDEYIDCEIRVYDNNGLIYTYPYKTFGSGKNTLSLCRVMDKLEQGEHILELRVYNNGTNDLIIYADDGVFSMLGKFTDMEEIPPIPVINEYDYIIFENIDATSEIAATRNAVSFFDCEEEVLLQFN